MAKWNKSTSENHKRLVKIGNELLAKDKEERRKAAEGKRRCPYCHSEVVTKKAFDKRKNIEYDRHWCKKCQKYVKLFDERQKKEQTERKKLLDKYTVTRLRLCGVSYRAIQTLLNEYSLGTIHNWADEEYKGSFTIWEVMDNVENHLSNVKVVKELLASRPQWRDILRYLKNENPY